MKFGHLISSLQPSLHVGRHNSLSKATVSTECLELIELPDELIQEHEELVSLWRHEHASPHICGLRRLIVQILERIYHWLLHSDTEGPALKPTGNFQHYIFSYDYSFKKMALHREATKMSAPILYHSHIS